MIVDVVSNIDETTIGVLKAGPKGLKGDQGDKAWSPIFAAIEDDDRIVFQVADWVGGEGAEPATGSYIGDTGYVVDIEDAVDFRGLVGPQGVSITSATVDGSYNLIVTYSSGLVTNAGYVRGAAGVAATIAVGTVTTLAAGSSATVTNVGTSAAAVFNFGLPRGADGQPTSTDGTLSANSDALVPTQKAVKTYADGLIEAANALQYKGTIACAANPNYPAANAGHMYIVSSAGKIGGASGLDVEIGDAIICKTDSSAAGTQASVGANWTILQFNLVGALTAGAIGVTVQAYYAALNQIGALSPVDNDFLQRKAGAWANRTIAQVKADFGISSFADTFLDDTSAAAVKTTLGISDPIALISTQTVGSAVASVSFTSIPSSGYSKFILIGKNVVTNNAATTDVLAIHVSTDNGSTWKTTSGDYITPNTGAAATRLIAAGCIGNTSTLKSGVFEIDLVGLGNAGRITAAIETQEIAGASASSIAGNNGALGNVRPVMEADNAIRIIPLNGTAISTGSVLSLYGVKE